MAARVAAAALTSGVMIKFPPRYNALVQKPPGRTAAFVRQETCRAPLAGPRVGNPAARRNRPPAVVLAGDPCPAPRPTLVQRPPRVPRRPRPRRRESPSSACKTARPTTPGRSGLGKQARRPSACGPARLRCAAPYPLESSPVARTACPDAAKGNERPRGQGSRSDR